MPVRRTAVGTSEVEPRSTRWTSTRPSGPGGAPTWKVVFFYLVTFSKLVCLDFVSFHFLNLCTMPTSISLDHNRLSCRCPWFRSQKRKRQKQWFRSRHVSGSQTAPTCLQSRRLRWVASLELVSHCDQVALYQGRRRRVCLTHNLDQAVMMLTKKPFV